MNAAARLVQRRVLARHLVLTHVLSRQQIGIAILTLLTLLSALGIIYITHVTRVMYASYQHDILEQNKLHVERGQLLLERSTLMMQARIEKTAETKLNMVIPDHQSIVVVRE
jgi:cell division protein FtsL